jgi:nitrogen fixation protein NifB
MQGCSNLKLNKYDHLVKENLSFNEETHIKNGKIHLPVSPKCNIQCKFCQRDINKSDNGSEVARSILTPKEAIRIVRKTKNIYPELSVVSIAGPGDTLATEHAIETFELIHNEFPDLLNCLSTNGLLLEEKAERLISAGVTTVTVTVNAINSLILEQICSHIIYKGKFMEGQKAVRWLLLSQLSGINKIAKMGAVVKVNTVLIPGVNDKHIGDIAKIVAKEGASIMNIVPLIPQNEMNNIKAPGCKLLNNAREAAEKYLPVFRYCKECEEDEFNFKATSSHG